MKYYSEKLDKIFETEKELEAAEKEHAEAEAKKAEAKELVKKESEKVNDAFKALNTAKRNYNKTVIEARKVYNKAVIDARDVYALAIDGAEKARIAAEKAYDEALKNFQSKHPEGYRLTLKDGDNVVTISNYGYDNKSLNAELVKSDSYKAFNEALDKILNTFLW